MERDNNSTIKDSEEELYLLFIDEERNKDLEKRFSTYINKYFNFNKNDKPDNTENVNKENKENKNEPKIIKFSVNQ